jgi:D-beta-D-heptose 7-phosphate kinase/D-beta-D-heptose 1-phosphate adenosyltransferase
MEAQAPAPDGPIAPAAADLATPPAAVASASSGGDAIRRELVAAVGRLSRTSLLVVGDAILDRTFYGEVERINAEAPVPVLAVQRELAVPGGAASVVRNLGALGAAVAFVSVVGDDQAGSELTGLIGYQPGVEPWLLVQGGRITTLKTRFFSQGQQMLRTDQEDHGPVHPKLLERLVRIARDAVAATSVTVLSDYRKGVLDGDVPGQIIAAARSAGRPVVAGVGGGDLDRYAGVSVMATPWRNLARAAGLEREDDASCATAGAALCRRNGFGALVVLRHGHGLSLLRPDDPPLHLRPPATELFDIAGAGDTILSVIGMALAANLRLEVGVRLAAVAASIVIGRVGTAVVREADLLSALSPQAVSRKLATREAAAERVERWRRAGWRTGFTHGVFATLNEGDVRLLEQARAACDRLVVGLSPGGSDQTERAAALLALDCVDLVVLEGEESPTELLRTLRPELLIDPAGRRGARAELVREWGGRVLQPTTD